jgi:hypothetical protein
MYILKRIGLYLLASLPLIGAYYTLRDILLSGFPDGFVSEKDILFEKIHTAYICIDVLVTIVLWRSVVYKRKSLHFLFASLVTYILLRASVVFIVEHIVDTMVHTYY